MTNFIKIGQTVADIWRFNGFVNGGRPPSWICWAPIGTTHDEITNDPFVQTLHVQIKLQNRESLQTITQLLTRRGVGRLK